LLNSIEIDKELERSKAIIESKGLDYVNAICYPYGDFDRNVLNVAEKYYAMGVSTSLGLQRMSEKPCLGTPRVNVSNALALHSGRLNYRLLRAFLKR